MAVTAVLELVIPGQPVGKARARRGRGNHWYTPDSTREYEERIRAAWMVEGRVHLGDGPLEVSATFVIGRPPSHLCKDGAPRSSAPAFPLKPDTDNLQKSIDALEGLAFANDGQIVRWVEVEKRYAGRGEEPHTVLELAPV